MRTYEELKACILVSSSTGVGYTMVVKNQRVEKPQMFQSLNLLGDTEMQLRSGEK